MEPTSSSSGKSTFTDMAASFQLARQEQRAEDLHQQKKRVNNVWSDIAQAEVIQETVDQFNVVSVIDKFIIQRGPETYEVGNKRKRRATDVEGEAKQAEPTKTVKQKRQKRSEGSEAIDSDEDESSNDEDTDYESDSSISSGGLSDGSKFDVSKRAQAKKLAFQNRKKTVPKKRTSREILEEQIKDQEDWQVANFIANRLKETKKQLIRKAMRILGREPTLKLFWKTLKIERLGGLMIKNNSRRRTPGGVFLYLLRNDKRIDQERIKEVFQEERQERKMQTKVTQVEKDQKSFVHLSKLLKKRLGGQAGSAKPANRKMEDANTDSEEEELADSYQLPNPEPAPAVLKFEFSTPSPHTSALTMASTAGPSNPSATVQPSQDRKTISYDDDLFDFNCEPDDF